MNTCKKCGADNQNNDTGYCKFCLAPLESYSPDNIQENGSSNQGNNSDQVNAAQQERSHSRHSGGTITQTRKQPPISAEVHQTENIPKEEPQFTPQQNKADEPDFEIKEVNFDNDSVPGLVSADSQPDDGFSEEKYFKGNDQNESNPDMDSLTADQSPDHTEEIRITMEQTENGPEINIEDDSDFSTLPEILPQEAAINEFEDEELEELSLTKKIIINPQVENKLPPEDEESINEKTTQKTPTLKSVEEQLQSDHFPGDKKFDQFDKPENKTQKKKPVLDRELLEKAEQTPKPSLASGIAYVCGNSIRFTGGYIPKIGQQIIIEDKAYELKNKPESALQTILSKIPKAVLFGTAGLIVLTALIIVASFAPTDDGQIAGMLIDPNTSQAVPKANVTIQELGMTVQTSYAGFFVFDNIPPGNYTIMYEDDGVGVVSERTTVLEGKTSTLALSLPENEIPQISNQSSRDISEQAPPRELKPGFMKLALSPGKSKVYLNGKYLGSGTQTFKVPAGRHQVTVKQDGYSSKSITVRIPEDQIKSYKVSLNKLKKNQRPEKKTDEEIAAELEQSGDYSGALKKYEKLLSQNHNDIDAILGRARCLKGIGKSDDALAGFLDGVKVANDRKDTEALLEALDGVLNINPNYLTARYKRGTVLLSQGQYFRAAQDFSKVVEIDRRHLNGYYKLGEAYYKAGNYTSAINAYEKVQELNFADAKPFAYIAKAYYKLDDKKNTKKYYEKFNKNADLTTQNEFRSDPEWQKIKSLFE